MPSLAELELEDLIKRAGQLNPEALTELHIRFYPQVYKYVSYRLDDPQTCEDISSEVFLLFLDAVAKKKKRIHNLRGWLFGTANHLVQDFYRRKYRRPTDDIDAHESLPAANSTAGEVDELQARRALRAALRTLTSEQQHVLALRFSQNLSLEDTAALMDKSINAVKALQFRALAALRKQLSGGTQ